MKVGGRCHIMATFPQKKTQYSLYWRLGEPQGRYVQMQKILPPLRFDPRTVQPTASHYIDYIIPAL